MLNSILFIVLLYLNGLFFGLIYKNKIDEKFIYITALLWGSLFFVLSFIFVFIFNTEKTFINVSLIFYMFLTIVFLYFAKNNIKAKKILTSIAVVTIIASFFKLFNIIILSADSFWIIHFSQNLALGDFEKGNVVLTMWGVFLTAIHSMNILFDEDIFYIYHPMISMTLIVFYIYSLNLFYQHYKLSSKYKNTFLIFSTLFLVLSNIFTYHFFLIHTGMISATYFFVFMISWLLFDINKNKSYLIFSILAIFSFSIMRIEMPIIGLILLFLFLSKVGIENRLKQNILIGFIVLISIWHIVLYKHIPYEYDLLGHKHILIILGFYVFGLIATLLISINIINKFFLNLVKITLYGLLVVSLLLIMVEPYHMLTSLLHIIQNLFITGRWGLVWWLVFVITSYLIFNKIKQYCDLKIIMTIVVIVLLFSYIIVISRIPYRLGTGDSFNRMVLHIYPIVVFYLSFWFMKYSNIKE
jgi:hypothetical protein